jgi:hypothetical protein
MKIFLTIIIAFSMSLLWKMGNQNYEESRDIHVAQKVQEIDDNEKFIFENKKI